jgi:hypothetical protein
LSEFCGTQFQEEYLVYLIKTCQINSNDVWFKNGAFRGLPGDTRFVLFWFIVEPFRIHDVANYLTHTFSKERDDSFYITKQDFEGIEESVKKLFRDFI